MSDFNYQEYLRNNPLFKKETTILTEGKNNLLKQDKLSSSEYQKAKKLKDFSKDDYKFDSSEDLYVKKSTLKENSIRFDNNLLIALTDLVDSHAATSGLTDEEAVMEVMEFLGQEYDVAFEFGRMMQEETSKSKMSEEELKAKIKEDIYSILNEEEDEEETEEVEVEDVEDIEPAEEASVEGLSQDEKEIQDNLKLAYDNAVAIGDRKLADQIGNSITFFTRTHVVER